MQWNKRGRRRRIVGDAEPEEGKQESREITAEAIGRGREADGAEESGLETSDQEEKQTRVRRFGWRLRTRRRSRRGDGEKAGAGTGRGDRGGKRREWKD